MEARANGPLPTIAVAMGDPSGISPELMARILAEPDLRAAARYVVFGDKCLLDLGAEDGKADPDVLVIKDGDEVVLRIDDNTKMRILKSSIVRIIPKDAPTTTPT